MHMMIVAKELTVGIRDPEQGTIGLQTLHGVPVRSNSNVTLWQRGDLGWGIRPIQRWSRVKIALWIIGSQAVGWIFLGLWLGLVSKTDLQNAFMVSVYLLAVTMGVLGVPSLLDII